jgi:hypothetical protein
MSRNTLVRSIAGSIAMVAMLLGSLLQAGSIAVDGLSTDDDHGLHASNFVIAGTAWNPGPNQVRSGGNPAPGSATFSIMAAGLGNAAPQFDSDHGNNLTASITALNVPGWSFNDYVDAINWALNTWDSVSGFTNLGMVADAGGAAGATQANGGASGDIRIAAWELTPTSLLAHTFQPGNESIFGAGGYIAGDMHLDINHIWRDDPTDLANDSDGDYDIYTVILHEIGHALGLMHPAIDTGSVMDASYGGARRALTADDIAGIQAIYGVPEPGTLVLAGLGGLVLLGIRLRCGKCGIA